MDFSQKMMLVPHSRARGLSDPKQKIKKLVPLEIWRHKLSKDISFEPF
jgi:hypothetical protein